MDSLLSIVQMPAGVPVATVGGRQRPQRRPARGADPRRVRRRRCGSGCSTSRPTCARRPRRRARRSGRRPARGSSASEAQGTDRVSTRSRDFVPQSRRLLNLPSHTERSRSSSAPAQASPCSWAKTTICTRSRSAELAQDRADVGLHRRLAGEDLARDLGVGQPLGHRVEHLPLLLGQREVRRRGRCAPCGTGRRAASSGRPARAPRCRRARCGSRRGASPGSCP